MVKYLNRYLTGESQSSIVGFTSDKEKSLCVSETTNIQLYENMEQRIKDWNMQDMSKIITGHSWNTIFIQGWWDYVKEQDPDLCAIKSALATVKRPDIQSPIVTVVKEERG